VVLLLLQGRQQVSCPAPGCEVQVPLEAVMQLLVDEPQLIEVRSAYLRVMCNF
jgi:hypothetical protein